MRIVLATNPGLHPDFSLVEYPAKLRAAIKSVARYFYVTRSFKPERVGNSEYWAILVRPTDEFSVYVNADREMLVVFSDYANFEIRTLEAFELFYGMLDSARIDKSLRFLISADSGVEGIIKHYLNQHPEYPIVIPTTFDKLEQRVGNPLLEAVRRNYLLRDLFGYQNPLREETFFFGRQDVVNNVLDMAKAGQSSSLFGLRKSGKTSTIYAISRKAKSFGCTATLIDCQSPGVHARRYGDLLAYVLSEVRKSIGKSKPLSSLGVTLPDISDNFSMHMKAILGLARNNVLIIFDEIENISPSTAASKHWRDEEDSVYFWQILRSFIQSESNGKLSICLVGTSPHLLEAPKIRGIANPMYLFSQKRFIPSLSFDDNRDMIEKLGYFMGLEFPVEAVADLQREYGGHPFFTRQVCSKVHQIASTNRPVGVSQEILKRAKADFDGQLQSYLKDILEQLNDFYPGEFGLLKSLIRGDTEEVREYDEGAPELIDHLVGYGLIAKVGSDFDVRFEAIKLALKALFRSDSLEEQWAEISSRRNRIENEMRIAIYHWTRSIEQDGWEIILMNSLTAKRFEGLSSLEPSYLFSKSTSPLYLSDLMMILKNPTVLPYLADRRSKIVTAIDTVNRTRKDAHANAVSASEIDAVRAAFDLLETEFSLV